MKTKTKTREARFADALDKIETGMDILKDLKDELDETIAESPDDLQGAEQEQVDKLEQMGDELFRIVSDLQNIVGEN